MKDLSELVERKHPALSVRKQCGLLGVARSSLAYARVAETPENLRIKRLRNFYSVNSAIRFGEDR